MLKLILIVAVFVEISLVHATPYTKYKEKKTETAAAVSFAGMEDKMEDQFAIEEKNEDFGISLYGVFDGHSFGKIAAQFTADNLFGKVKAEIQNSTKQYANYGELLKEVITKFDKEVIEKTKEENEISGTCAIIALIHEEELYIANLGDSRAVIATNNGTAFEQSIDQTSYNPDEFKRVIEAGNTVDENGYILGTDKGGLMPSRSLGDWVRKSKARSLIAEPVIMSRNLKDDQIKFIILASDGLWDEYSSLAAVKFINNNLDEAMFGAEQLAINSKNNGSIDDITVMVIKTNQFPSPKNKEKETEMVAAASFAGKDVEMEAQFAIEENIEGLGISLYGVFDGHGGKLAAEYTSINLFERLKVEIQEQKEKYANYGELLKEVVTKFDEEVITKTTEENDESGTCAIIALIHGAELYVANVGDSRAVISTKNGAAFDETIDQKLRNPDELKRVTDAGSTIDENGYILGTDIGGLMPSRSLGDRVRKSKAPSLIAEPEIMSRNLKDDQIKFILLASAGLWDRYSSKAAVKFIDNNYYGAMFGAEQLAINGLNNGSTDDIAVMVIKTNRFPYKETKTETVAAVSFASKYDKKQVQFAIEENIDGSEISLYGVFDGHTGKYAAQFTADNLFGMVKAEIKNPTKEYPTHRALLQNVIEKFETKLNEELSTRKTDKSGTSAIIALIDGAELYIANIGDSRAVLSTANGKFVGETLDHLKRNTSELKRVKDAGGDFDKYGYMISKVGRSAIQTRTLGDREQKTNTPGLIAEPEIISRNLKKDKIKFIILASDGLWRSINSNVAAKFINDNFNKDMFGAELLAVKAKAKGSTDDITVMVIKTNRFPYKEEITSTVEAFSFAGRDDKMEDQFAIEENIEGLGISLYGVFDGHGGKLAAQFTADNLFGNVKTEIQNPTKPYDNYGVLLKEVVTKFEQEVIKKTTEENDDSGTCAIIALIYGEELYVANVGDSRAVIATKNGTAFEQSIDQTSRNLIELKRVTEAGSTIGNYGYIVGTDGIGIIPSRSLGDRTQKANTPGLLAEPEIMSRNLKDDQTKFIILASDGLWDKVNSENAVKFINDNFNETTLGAEQLAKEAKAKGSIDDITVMVIKTNQLPYNEKKTDTAAAVSYVGKYNKMQVQFAIEENIKGGISLYGVFDGHNGKYAAKFTADHLLGNLKAEIENPTKEYDSYEKLLDNVIKEFETELNEELSRMPKDISGTSAVIALIHGEELYVANVGDSRAVIGTADGKSFDASTDHTRRNASEVKRVEETPGGAFDEKGYIINAEGGGLLVTRSLGDRELKSTALIPGLIAEPEVSSTNLKEVKSKFIILASDGLWYKFTSEDAVKFINDNFDETMFGAKKLAIEGKRKGSTIEITIMVIKTNQF